MNSLPIHAENRLRNILLKRENSNRDRTLLPEGDECERIYFTVIVLQKGGLRP